MELGHSSLTNPFTKSYCNKNPQQTYKHKLENNKGNKCIKTNQNSDGGT
jgi:hypothetical protein